MKVTNRELQLQMEVEHLEEALAWMVEAVIKDERIQATPDPKGWIAKALAYARENRRVRALTKSELDRAVTALGFYGGHKLNCRAFSPVAIACTCGWEKFLESGFDLSLIDKEGACR